MFVLFSFFFFEGEGGGGVMLKHASLFLFGLNTVHKQLSIPGCQLFYKECLFNFIIFGMAMHKNRKIWATRAKSLKSYTGSAILNPS